MSRPSPAVTSTRFTCTSGRNESPIQRIIHPSSAPTPPMATAQAMVATVGSTAGGTEGRANEKLPSPVHASSPTNTRAPMPEASNPGRATRLSVIPPTPAASMIRNAPRMGDPNSVLMAAKLPADAMIVSAIGGASFFSRCTVKAPSPPPMAMRGASGPRTAPRLSVANAARTTAGSSLSTGGPPPVVKPNAGEFPPLPGR